MIKRIAIFSDIHGNVQALTEILKDIKKRKIKTVYCLGDTIGIGPKPKECMDLIIENNIKIVLGNHELYYLKGTDIDKNIEGSEKEHHKWVKSQLSEKHETFLKTCNISINKKIGKYKISFQHFLLNNNIYPFENLSILYDGTIGDRIKSLNSDITFIGHEHKAFELEDSQKRIIDVGSSGCTKDNHTFYTILTIDDDNIKIDKIELTYNRKSFEQDLNTISYPDKEIISKIFFGI